MVVDSRHQGKTFKVEKKLSEPIKKFWNPENYFRVKKNNEIEKKITKSRKKILKSRKIFWNREKNFRIEKNISESRKLFQN